ncbi:MAG: GH25 family lysozyme [Lachnospiraceae bacterium]
MKAEMRRRFGIRMMCLAGVISMGISVSALAAEPWSKVGGHFIYADGTVINGAMEKGVSVSKYQNHGGEIDWKKVASDDVTFAMIRLDTRKIWTLFEENMREAAAAGLKTGVFFYSQAADVESARKEAEFVLNIIKDYPVSFPVAYDVGAQKLLDQGLSKQEITEQVNAFCQVIKEAGYRPAVYVDYEWLTKHMDVGQVPYDIWYSRYGVASPSRNRSIWQCADDGQVDGITGSVCVEFAFTDYGKLIPSEGWRKIGDDYYYYKDHVKQTGWVLVNNSRYYLDKNGIMLYDTTVEIDGTACTFDADGRYVEKREYRVR